MSLHVLAPSHVIYLHTVLTHIGCVPHGCCLEFPLLPHPTVLLLCVLVSYSTCFSWLVQLSSGLSSHQIPCKPILLEVCSMERDTCCLVVMVHPLILLPNSCNRFLFSLVLVACDGHCLPTSGTPALTYLHNSSAYHHNHSIVPL